MMRGLHVGYEQRTEYALREVFGDDYLTREASWTMNRPWVDTPTDFGAIEHRVIPRTAIFIEGENSKLAPVLEALRQMSEDA